MADLNPMVPGDVPYPQYSVIRTIKVTPGIEVIKGHLHNTTAGTGMLDIPGSSLENGAFQAMGSIELSVAGDEVQVLAPRSRMIFTAGADDLHKGRDVIIVLGTTNVVVGTKAANLYIGKIFEIYTKNSDGTEKDLTITGDRVIVETVGP